MIDEKKKMTTQDSSVGADDGQSISKNSDICYTLPQRGTAFWRIPQKRSENA